ncbi:hypothetical protein [Comamonas aquatica]|uniref:hypothetical protein n=1 Tax=Comamonas aquatica TaxID=225991 RepID=UPI000B1F4CF2|nr:hypothetical protein [Comamonas aquatica]
MNTSAMTGAASATSEASAPLTALEALQREARWATATPQQREVLKRIALQRDRWAAARQAREQALAQRPAAPRGDGRRGRSGAALGAAQAVALRGPGPAVDQQAAALTPPMVRDWRPWNDKARHDRALFLGAAGACYHSTCVWKQREVVE